MRTAQPDTSRAVRSDDSPTQAPSASRMPRMGPGTSDAGTGVLYRAPVAGTRTAQMALLSSRTVPRFASVTPAGNLAGAADASVYVAAPFAGSPATKASVARVGRPRPAIRSSS
ncbi:MAG: hypothetical protein BWY76_02981 [bacterium ADurb.Bin429]|nr:MAG: hypothetical protein BWY76_02981 [bacterium ADurb.Bin429]